MNKKHFIPGLWILLVLGIVLASCKDDEPAEPVDYLVFGTFYGECVGETCIEIFRLEGDQLFEDTTDQYPGSLVPLGGDYVLLLQEKYELVKDIIGPIPESLFNAPTVIGQPDAGDWGGAYLEVRTGGVHKFWLIDLMLPNIPEEYHELVGQIQTAVALIND